MAGLDSTLQPVKEQQFACKANIFIELGLSFSTMVCEKCEKKLGRVITPDPWKSGARNTVESGGRKIGENKAITGNKSRFSPYTAKFETCRICRQKVHQVGSHYCQACAYKKGICAMCGKKLLDTKNYKQSSA
uniref:Cysteine-rich PDZ-binding protein n=1 Tax=Timema douglasi TaxID=61478 RepID=A0A7R8Z7T2_TIMDO|nr:unnamed protein product [Timema douglasi]